MKFSTGKGEDCWYTHDCIETIRTGILMIVLTILKNNYLQNKEILFNKSILTHQ